MKCHFTLRQTQGGIGKPGPACEVALVRKSQSWSRRCARACLLVPLVFLRIPSEILRRHSRLFPRSCPRSAAASAVGKKTQELYSRSPLQTGNVDQSMQGSPVGRLAGRYLGFNPIFGAIPPWLGIGSHPAVVIAPLGSLFFRVLRKAPPAVTRGVTPPASYESS